MSAAYRSPSYRSRGTARSRAGAILLSAALLVLLLLALLWLGAGLREPGDPGRALATFDVASGDEAETTAKRAPEQRQRAEQRPRPEQAPPPPPTAEPPPVEAPIPLPDFMRMSRSDYAATDIGRIARDPGSASGTAVADTGGGDSTPGEPGAAPGGETLYPAEWYREPTRAELATYMPKRPVVEGWGMIVCRTIDRFHVEDCRELSESPGSGLARTMRQAAWQFLVRPPRINGKPKTGTWVRIRFDIRRAG